MTPNSPSNLNSPNNLDKANNANYPNDPAISLNRHITRAFNGAGGVKDDKFVEGLLIFFCISYFVFFLL